MHEHNFLNLNLLRKDERRAWKAAKSPVEESLAKDNCAIYGILDGEGRKRRWGRLERENRRAEVPAKKWEQNIKFVCCGGREEQERDCVRSDDNTSEAHDCGRIGGSPNNILNGEMMVVQIFNSSFSI